MGRVLGRCRFLRYRGLEGVLRVRLRGIFLRCLGLIMFFAEVIDFSGVVMSILVFRLITE